MHTVIGNGDCKIVYLNCTDAQNVDELFQMLIGTHHMMRNLGYPKQQSYYRKNSMIFTNDPSFCRTANLCIDFNGNAPGVYSGSRAYHKQIAKRISFESGLPIFIQDEEKQNICIGIGNESSVLQNYMVLKDSILYLPDML